MTAEQWRIALRIYSAAQEIALEERRAFIDSATVDPEVVQEVLDLLEAAMEADTGPPSTATPTDRTGTRIGRYAIGKLLGRGGMGEVYAAHDTELDRPAALKFLLSETIGDRSGIRRFVREAKAASALNHPNILTVYEVVYAESGPAIAMELVEGKAFREFRGTPLAPEQVVDLGRQIASALAAAHEKGIMHSREIVYSTRREYGGAGLWRLRISGGGLRRLASTLDFAGNPNISRQGDRLAYTESWIDSNIYRSDGPGFTASGVPGGFGAPQKVIASSREDHSPSFSPDGERIAFVSNRTGHSEIWTADRDGGREVRLTHFESFTGTPRWSPDGRWIAFDCITDGNKDIWVISAQGGAPRRLTTDPAPDTKPSWSPDGAWIYFNSDRSGAAEIWKIRPDGSAATQLTWDGGREPLPSADGRTIYYTKQVGPAPIWTVPAEGGPERPLAGMEEFNKVGRSWGVLKEGIYFASAEPGARAGIIGFFSFATRRVMPLRSWEERTLWTLPAVAISADGRYLLTVQIDQQLNDLMMIKNFR